MKKEATTKQIVLALRLEVAELTSMIREMKKEKEQAKLELKSDADVGKILLATFVPKLNKQIKITSDIDLNEEDRSTLLTQAVNNYENLFTDKTELLIDSGNTFVKNEGRILQINAMNKEFNSTMLKAIYFDTASNEVIAEFKKSGKKYKYFPNNLSNEEWTKKVSELMKSQYMSKFFRNEFIRQDDLISFQEL